MTTTDKVGGSEEPIGGMRLGAYRVRGYTSIRVTEDMVAVVDLAVVDWNGEEYTLTLKVSTYTATCLASGLISLLIDGGAYD